MKLRHFLLAFAVMLSCGILAQESNPPSSVSYGRFIKKTIPLRDMPTVDASEFTDAKNLKIIPNNLRANEKVNASALPLGDDPIAQKAVGSVSSFNLEENFDGATAAEGGATPPDPTGAVGPNHYVHAVNLVVKIFDKTGTLLAGPTSLGSFLGSGNNSGDPIVMYDQLADRYFVSQFGAAPNSLVLGVSDTNDPTGAYNVYEFVLSSFPDYPHYSVWPDGYYVTANKFSGNTTYVMERDVILAGGANPQIVGFDLPGVNNNPNTVFSPEPANLTGTTFPTNVPGYIVYLQDDGWGGGITFDHLKIWEIDVDWTNIGNSTISSPLEVPVASFDSVFAPFGSGDVAQPGTSNKIDMIGGVISYAANYRSFGTHNSWLITFNVDVDGNDTSGVRWVELRNDAVNDWSVFQEGTYAPNDGHSRFMGSGAMDAAGNIGIGFNIASATLPVGVRYTGRFDGDPLGQMTVAETTIVDGVGVQTNTNRFGDYSHLTMDPNNFTFWHTAEYFTSNNFWVSRIASFSLTGGFSNDVGVNDIIQPVNGLLTNSETVEVSIRNFGSAVQTNIPLELRVDGNLIATETYTGTVNPNDTDSYTFTATVDLSNSGQTYNIEVTSLLASDEFNANDGFSKDVTHLLADDVGTLEITAPETGLGLGSETVSITVKNFGANPQSNFDVEYSIDGAPTVVETFTGTINSEEELSFDFATPGDFSALGVYNIAATTSLGGDQDTTNDEVTAVVENLFCQPSMDCSFGDGLQLFSLAEINNPSGCEGYGDFRNQIANLEADNTYSLTVTTGYGDQHLNVWIDFNDDFTFSPNELVVNDYIIAPGQAGGSYTETLDLVVPAGVASGQHVMRAKTNWQAPVPADACAVTSFGETEDYTANLGTLGAGDIALRDSELIVTSLPNNQFEISLITEFDGSVYAAIYNTLGQQLGFKNLNRSGNSYNLNLDMSVAASGVYLIKVGGQFNSTYKTARIIVN
jgi:hypothetical protein